MTAPFPRSSAVTFQPLPLSPAVSPVDPLPRILPSLLTPLLEKTAATLRALGYRVTPDFDTAGKLGLTVLAPQGGPGGWLCFQIRRSFAPQLGDEPRLFWMFAATGPHAPARGRAGRLLRINDATELRSIVDEFASLFPPSAVHPWTQPGGWDTFSRSRAAA